MNQQHRNASRGFQIEGSPVLTGILKQLTGLAKLEKRYQKLPLQEGLFFQAALNDLNIRWEVSPTDLARIPQSGPVILLANHPFGAVDGMILSALAKSIRPDAKVLANSLLKAIPESDQVCIYVDPFGSRDAARANLKGLREAKTWLAQGGLLGAFPSGEVAHWNPKTASITEGAWHPHFLRMAKASGATVVPIYFQGRNSLSFQVLGKIHPLMKLALLPKELANKANLTIYLKIGNPIPVSKLANHASEEEATAYLRQRTLLLGSRTEKQDIKHKRVQAQRRASLIPPVPRDLLEAEIAMLPTQSLLLESGEFQVRVARANQIPQTLREIGRLRELAFRAEGEGTGKSLDLDLFDEYYLHLFLWHPGQGEVAGAYRLGEADRIYPRFRKKGFYTHSLFKYRSEFFSRIGQALEMGRSFVSPQYQKSFSPLLLLWKGIAAFIAQNPQYTLLFGPVSISGDYSELSKEWMVDYLKAHCFHPQLSPLVKPRHPFKSKLAKKLGLTRETAAMDQARLAELVEELEGGQRSIPILLKQYLKLGGQLLGFNLDPTFGNCLDGLLMVDLLHTEVKNLEKYLGKEEAARYLAYHQQPK